MKSNFNELGISPPILKALEDMGFVEPTEVQAQAIPHILNREDLIVKSKTGSGKTAVFGVSILQLTDPEAAGPQGLILTPTRELAVQIDSDIQLMARHLQHKTTVVYGQHNISTEVQALKKNPTIVTGTPGRLFDHIRHSTLNTGHIRFLVLDEADRMLDMGFIDQVMKIVKTIPRDRVTLLFSATIPDEIHRICSSYMKNPVTISVESQTKTVDSIRQLYYRVNGNEKNTQLNRLLLVQHPDSCMIFCNTRIAVDRVTRFLNTKGYAAQALHGDIPQAKRMKTIQQFKEGEFRLLVATDVAARGIHIDELSLVINYDVPVEKDSYVHRIGRTGRAGHEGLAITLATTEDIMSLYEIEEHIGALIEEKELPTEAEYLEHKEESDQWVLANALKNPPAPAAPGQRDRTAQKKRPPQDKPGQGRPRRPEHTDETGTGHAPGSRKPAPHSGNRTGAAGQPSSARPATAGQRDRTANPARPAQGARPAGSPGSDRQDRAARPQGPARQGPQRPAAAPAAATRPAQPTGARPASSAVRPAVEKAPEAAPKKNFLQRVLGKLFGK